MLRELSVGECESVIRTHHMGRLAMRDAEGAYIVPISYAMGEDAIYAHAAPGHKVQLMRLWPHVALQIDEIEDDAHWRSVLIRGRFEELHHDDDREHARLLLVRAFGGNPVSVTAGHGHRTALADAILFRIKIEDISGRAEGL